MVKALSAACLAAVLSSSAIASVPASCRLHVPDNDGHRSIGSGVLVSQNLIATNAHVVRDWSGRQIRVNFPDGKTVQATVLSREPKMDVAILRCLTPVNVTPIALGTRPDIGESVWLSGYGQIGQAWDRQGRVLGYRDAPGASGRAWYVVTGPSRGGDSGAPVVGLDGTLRGLTWGTDASTTMVVRAGAIRYLLAQCGPQGCSPQYRTVPNQMYQAPPRGGYLGRQSIPTVPYQAPVPPRRGVPIQPGDIPAPQADEWAGNDILKSPGGNPFANLQNQNVPQEMPGPTGPILTPPSAPVPPSPVPPKAPALAQQPFTESGRVRIVTGLNPSLRGIFNAEEATGNQQIMVLGVQQVLELQKLNDKLDTLTKILEKEE